MSPASEGHSAECAKVAPGRGFVLRSLQRLANACTCGHDKAQEVERLRAEIIAQCEASLAASEAASHYQMQAVEARNGLRCVLALLRGAP